MNFTIFLLSHVGIKSKEGNFIFIINNQPQYMVDRGINIINFSFLHSPLATACFKIYNRLWALVSNNSPRNTLTTQHKHISPFWETPERLPRRANIAPIRHVNDSFFGLSSKCAHRAPTNICTRLSCPSCHNSSRTDLLLCQEPPSNESLQSLRQQ